MSTASEPTSAARAAAPARARTFVDRLLAALPLAGIALAVLVFYGIEAWTRKTPWVFTDEIEWTQISRSIEETGHAARRGEPIFFKSLYAFVIAPFWAIQSTETAYAAIKYANVVVMTLAAVPTYLLARMLLPKRWALAVALLSICIPGMAYVTSLVPEVLAYPWYALCSWLIVRALVSGRTLDQVLAALAATGALLVRDPQFATVFAAWAIAAAVLWTTGPRGRAFRAGRPKRDILGLAVLLVGGLMLFNRVILQHVEIWQVSTQYFKDRMVDLGLRAGLAFTVGMGILPVVGGIASLNLPERRSDPVYRAFAAYLGGTLVAVGLYTAVKAAYLSTVFSTLTEERNLIYLSPLMLIGTALVLTARQVDWRLVAAATALVVFLVFEKPFQLLFPYFEAPGFAILTIPTRHWSWTVETLRIVLVVVLVLSLLALAFRRVPGVDGAAVVLCAAWMLTPEIASTVGFDDLANRFRAHLPAQLDWVDQRVGGKTVTYLGQEIADPNGLLLTEFWNRSVRHVYSLDGSAPGPGPAGAPDLVSPDGRLAKLPETDYVLADSGVALQAPVVDRWQQLTLYRKAGPWRLLDAVQQVYSDGWAPGWSSYTYFKPGRRGTLEVTLSRTGCPGCDTPPGQAKLTVGTVRVDPAEGIQFGRVTGRLHRVVQNGASQVVRIPVERTPVRVVIEISPTFRASVSDPRELGAQVAFRFVPAKGR